MNPSEICVELTNYLENSYFNIIKDSKKIDLLYSDSAVIYYQKEEFQGKEGAQEFADKIKDFSIRVNGSNVQEMHNSKTWAVLSIFGTIKIDPHIQNFNTVMNVEIDEDNRTVLIYSQTFNII